MIVTLPFLDNFWPSFEGTKAAYRGSMVVAALLYIVEGVLREVARRGGEGRMGAVRGIGLWMLRAAAAFGGVAAAMHVMATHASNFGDVAILPIFRRDFYFLPLLLMSLVVTRRWEAAPCEPPTWGRWMLVARVALFALFAAALVSCATSYHPLDSLRDFRNDLGASLTSVVVLLGVLRTPSLVRWIVGCLLGVAVYIALINFFGLHRFGGATEIERLAWIDVGLVYAADYYHATPAIRPLLLEIDFRPTFPFGHHNRLSNFAMMATATGLILAAWPGLCQRRRVMAVLGAATCFVLLNLTLGRGAWLAFFAGMAGALLLVFDPRRRSHLFLGGGCVALAVLGFALLPAGQKERILSLGTSARTTWTMVMEPGGDDLPEDLNARRRLIAMETAVAAIRAEPLTGVGYGFHAYELMVPTFQPASYEADPQESEQFQTHSHNNLLQVAAESGLPALGAFLAFHVVLFGMTVVAVRRAHARHASLRWPATAGLALFLMTHAYGMTNYSLRYTLGHLTWLSWVIVLRLALCAAAEGEGGGRGGDAGAPDTGGTSAEGARV